MLQAAVRQQQSRVVGAGSEQYTGWVACPGPGMAPTPFCVLAPSVEATVALTTCVLALVAHASVVRAKVVQSTIVPGLVALASSCLVLAAAVLTEAAPAAAAETVVRVTVAPPLGVLAKSVLPCAVLLQYVVAARDSC